MRESLGKGWRWNKESAAELLTQLLERLWEQGLGREQLQEVLRCETQGRFHLVDAGQMKAVGQLVARVALPDYASTSALRARLREICVDLNPIGGDDLELAVGEVAGNAVKHGGEGWCEIYRADDQVTVRIGDGGSGIKPGNIRKSVTTPGFSTKATLGLGFTLVLNLVDVVWLATGPEGTIIQLCKRL